MSLNTLTKRENFFTELLNLLKLDPKNRFYSDNGEILRNKVYESAMKMDSDLIKLLLSSERMKQKFFTKVDDILVFDKISFGWAINNKAFLQDSYTRFKNTIGLIDSKEQFISSKNDVVLSFPYKDCVLEGGQTKEDQKRGEIFYNELLAPDDVDRLLAPKVFTNIKRYTKDGEEFITEFKDNDNLLIKGNNLLALSSILKRYEGRVKCIYIDPPYNTGSDSFNYNDRYNHSTWLTFMKNRLQIAKSLLSSDGSIFIQCDDNEEAYLKILLDEIFGRDKFMNQIIWRYRTYQGQVKDYFPKKHDVIFWYINKERPNFKLSYQDNYTDTVDYSRWKDFYVDGNKIKYPNYPKTDSRFTAYLDKYKKEHGQVKDGDIIYEVKGYIVDDVWEDIKAIDAKDKTQKTDFKGGQKPEELIARIINSVTNENDIILDFHVGSGTTCAVAHKLKRQWIGIEQMDYIETITYKRLKDVVNGEQGGVSESVNWHGGGSFVYCELKELNHKYIDEIQVADDNKLNELYKEITDSEFISYKADINKLKESEQDFKELSTEDKRNFLIQVLDKNLLYVNYCDMEDKDLAVTEEEKAFARSFYGEGI